MRLCLVWYHLWISIRIETFSNLTLVLILFLNRLIVRICKELMLSFYRICNFSIRFKRLRHYFAILHIVLRFSRQRFVLHRKVSRTVSWVTSNISIYTAITWHVSSWPTTTSAICTKTIFWWCKHQKSTKLIIKKIQRTSEPFSFTEFSRGYLAISPTSTVKKNQLSIIWSNAFLLQLTSDMVRLLSCIRILSLKTLIVHVRLCFLPG